MHHAVHNETRPPVLAGAVQLCILRFGHPDEPTPTFLTASVSSEVRTCDVPTQSNFAKRGGILIGGCWKASITQPLRVRGVMQLLGGGEFRVRAFAPRATCRAGF